MKKPTYIDGTEIKLGDQVHVRYLLFWKDLARVVYIPGISEKNPQLEYNGLSMVAVKTEDKSAVISSLLDPKTYRLGKSIQFISRMAIIPNDLIGPSDDLDDNL